MSNDVPLESVLLPLLGPGEMVVQAIAVVVGMDQNGSKWISHFRSSDMRTWEARGLVEDMRDTLTVTEFLRQFEDEDED